VSKENFRIDETIFVNSQEQTDHSDHKDSNVPKMIEETDDTLWVALIVEIRARYPLDQFKSPSRADG